MSFIDPSGFLDERSADLLRMGVAACDNPDGQSTSSGFPLVTQDQCNALYDYIVWVSGGSTDPQVQWICLYAPRICSVEDAGQIADLLDAYNERIEQIEGVNDRHNDRNAYQNPWPTLDEAIANNWVRETRDLWHRHGEDGQYNVKYLSPDGHEEAVYDLRTGNLVTDPANMGTFNYCPPDDFCHFTMDILPYWFRGNAPNDPTPWYNRVLGPAPVNPPQYDPAKNTYHFGWP
jgi:hypothetical protein